MKIAVLGSINMDTTVVADRIPKKGETLMGSSVQYIPGGKGANQAVSMAKLGAEVEMFGCVGDDSFGTQLIDNLKETGVGTDHIKRLNGIPTGMAFVTVGEQDNTIIVVSGANGQVNKEYVDQVKDKLAKFDMVVLQHEIPLETVTYVISFCSQNQIPVILNPAPALPVPLETIEQVTYLTPNEHEAAILFGKDHKLEETLKDYPEKLIVTQGSRGVTTCLKTGVLLNVPARKAQVVDTTGAGDTLNGAFAVGLANGLSIKDALTFANNAASLSTEKFGAQGGMPTYQEVMTEWKGKK